MTFQVLYWLIEALIIGQTGRYYTTIIAKMRKILY